MFKDPKTIEAWFGTQREEPIEEVFTQIHAALLQLYQRPLAPVQRITFLEAVRTALPTEIARAAKAFYADRPLPLGQPEREMLGRIHSVMSALEEQYWACGEEFAKEPESDTRTLQVAGALQRCVHAMVTRMIEDYRARQVIDPVMWELLHRTLDKAASCGVGAVSVSDPLNPHGRSTINATYGRAALLAAAQAGAMTPRILDATLALTALLEPFIDCSWQPMGNTVDATHEVTRTGRIRIIKAAGMTHFLNNTRLSGALNAFAQKVATGEPIASLDALPISRSEVSGLLARLNRVWCGAGEIRGTERERTEDRAEMASGIYAIYKLITEKEFALPREFHVYSASGRPGDGSATVKDREGATASGESGTWTVLDRSGEGLRAVRPVDGGRVGRGRLMGIRMNDDAKSVSCLAEVRWVQEIRGTSISSGVKMLPGRVIPVPARVWGGKDGKQYQGVAPAFILDHGNAPKLVVPTGWWSDERLVDIHFNGVFPKIRMGELLMRGVDFELGRFTFEGRPPQGLLANRYM